MTKNKDISFEQMKHDFPIFTTHPKLIYVDNAATTQKPQVVLDAMQLFYTSYNSNVHRGIHFLSERATDAYENVRKKLSQYLHVDTQEIVFTYGTTHGINTLAFGFKHLVAKGDEIVITAMEHHANIVPWQEVCKQRGATLKVIPLTKDGRLDEVQAKKILTSKTKILSLSHSSNVLGTINDVSSLISYAKQQNSQVLAFVDGAQEISRGSINLEKMGCDGYVFSAHKMYGPTGVGALYLRKELFDKIEPLLYGGSMIEDVSFEKTTYAKGFHKLEAGTPSIADVIGLGAAIDYITSFDQKKMQEYKTELIEYFLQEITVLGDDFTLYGPKDSFRRNPVFSFTYAGIHPNDLTKFLDEYFITVRSGHHCAIPLHKELGITGTTRISLSMYNTKEDIDKIISALQEIKKIFS